jgi:hypothetical protein
LVSEQEHAVESHLANLLVHLLKWRYQPEGGARAGSRASSWRGSALPGGSNATPACALDYPLLLIDAYIDARALTASQTELELNIFPDQFPWTMEQLQDSGFLPEGYVCTTCSPVVAPRNMCWKPQKNASGNAGADFY